MEMEDVTYEMFSRVLVYDLVRNGAATTGELQERLRFNKIRLIGDEVLVVIERARRAGLIEPLGHPARADGSLVKQSEWTATAGGRDLPPPVSEETVTGNELLMYSLRHGLPFRTGSLIKLAGLTTVVAVLSGASGFSTSGAVWLGFFLFVGLVTLILITIPIRARGWDWLVVNNWPRYKDVRESNRQKFDELKARKKLRSRFSPTHLRYWDYVSRRADILNQKA
jgi:hypothetical protein